MTGKDVAHPQLREELCTVFLPRKKYELKITPIKFQELLVKSMIRVGEPRVVGFLFFFPNLGDGLKLLLVTLLLLRDVFGPRCVRFLIGLWFVFGNGGLVRGNGGRSNCGGVLITFAIWWRAMPKFPRGP